LGKDAKIYDMDIYSHPLYYDIAFSFFDVKKQVDCFEKIIKRFSKIKVKRFLDVACGPSLQLREIAKRGYECIGLDSSPEMLAYLRKKANEEGVKIEIVQADMCDFKLGKKADFAFIMMGSLVVESDAKFLKHLNCLADCLKSGALYFIQNKAVDWTAWEEQTWTMKRDEVTVKTCWGTEWRDVVNQIYAEKQVTKVDDNGHTMKFEDLEEKVYFSSRVQNTNQVERKVRVFGMVGRNGKYVVSKQTAREIQVSKQY
jgi:SAM-dependent methyltransferase